MMGATHRLFGAACGATVATVAGQSETMILMAGLVASASSHGWASPDVDQTRPWVVVRRSLPGVGRWMNHRTGITHWWGLALGVWLLVELCAPVEALWPARALLVGWTSHLVGDAVFGKVPVWPAGPMVGVGLRTDGFVESGKLGGKRIVPLSPLKLGLLMWVGWMAQPVMPEWLKASAAELATRHLG